MLGDPDEAADAAQQSFVQAYYHLPKAKLDLPFKPWIFRIARNQCIDRIRERRTTKWCIRQVGSLFPLRLGRNRERS